MDNMAEKYTPPQNTDKDDLLLAGEQAVAMSTPYNSPEAEAARRLIEQQRTTPEVPTPEKAYEQGYAKGTKDGFEAGRRKGVKAGVAGTVLTGLTVAGAAGVAAYEAKTAAPEFSEQTTTYTVEPGDGVFDAAQEIKGLRDIRDGIAHIEADPANIDVLEDGLQPGEQLVIPVSVEGYEEEGK